MGGSYLNHHLLLLMHIKTKVELGIEPGLEHRHSNMECGHFRWHINCSTKVHALIFIATQRKELQVLMNLWSALTLQSILTLRF